MQNISKVEGDLTRQLLWRSLFDMMRDARVISAPELAVMMMENYPLETSLAIRSKLGSFMAGTIHNYSPESEKDFLNHKGFKLILELIKKETVPETIYQLHKKLLGFVTDNKECLDNIAQLLKDKHEFLSLKHYEIGSKFHMLNTLFVTKA